jgi:hypothetical protein
MTNRINCSTWFLLALSVVITIGHFVPIAYGQTITPSDDWKHTVVFKDDRFFADSFSTTGPKWVKFMILSDPYDSSQVYYQNSTPRKYVFHYDAAVALLDPFKGMSVQQFNEVSLFEQNQQVVLGTVLVAPKSSVQNSSREPEFPEYGIQFVRQDPFSKEQIRDLFNAVKASVTASIDLEAFYFPTFEQQDAAQADADWFATQGISLSSPARWAKGNTCYAKGWAMGQLKFVTANEIDTAYHEGRLSPSDILLTDGIPAELPYLAGIISLVPSTPNSHVAILAKTYGIPFVHLLIQDDAEAAQALEGQRILYSAFNDFYGDVKIQMININALDDSTIADILQLKQSPPLKLSAIEPFGDYGVSTMGLIPADIKYVGGKASNFGILNEALPQNSPTAMALTFDVWDAFLDQPLATVPKLVLNPGEHILFWADGDPEQGSTHTNFRLNRKGESIALFDHDGLSLIDSIAFGKQDKDISYGRSTDGHDTWQLFDMPTPGTANTNSPPAVIDGLVINELMADNKTNLADPCRPNTHPDWIELYNGSSEPIVLNGLYLTDTLTDPTQWQIPRETNGSTLRERIAHLTRTYQSYPPSDMLALSGDLAAVRSLFTNGDTTVFSDEQKTALLNTLSDPNIGFNPEAKLRFRSSTNVEDSDDFIGAGLYDSYSGCLAASLGQDHDGAPVCDPNDDNPRTVFSAIRKTFASFYNNNAFLERLRHQVDESQVGMALLVHHSFPDELELANGVATIDTTPQTNDYGNTTITLVSQIDANSVTNPADGSTPEEVVITVTDYGSVTIPNIIGRYSSLVPIGGKVMAWKEDYEELAEMLMQVSDQYQAVTGRTSYVLDLEYKIMAPGDQTLPEGGLVIKQVRQVPTPAEDATQMPFLVNEPTEYEVFTGEFTLEEEVDIFAQHRLKSRWSIETRNMPIDGAHLVEPLYTTVTIEYIDDDHIDLITRTMDTLDSVTHTYNDTRHMTTDVWTIEDMTNPRTYGLKTTDIPHAVAATNNPILTVRELGSPTSATSLGMRCLTLDVEYSQPVTLFSSRNPDRDLRQTMKNQVYLWPRDAAPKDDDIYEERSLSQDGISLETAFYYPAPPGGLSSWVGGAGATAPLKRWEQTTITGLSSEPIVLKGYYSQTLHPEHHNFIEHFLFEPQLEPELSSDILAELKAMDVRYIRVIMNFKDGPSSITTHGFDVK